MNKTSKIPNNPQLFPGVEDKTQEALGTFIELTKCTYQDKSLGNSHNEFMECDCFENWTTDKDGNIINGACGEDLDCINRLTLIECVDGLCDSTCGKECQNQRFQRRQYANIMVFQTEKKGYGVIAKEDIEPNQFIYEYIGEVIDEEEFKDRMLLYDQERIKHFYFMMLQNGQFIDATKKGCLARFCNHSCNPNAYVNKWVVNGKLKMGIFAKRKILKDEEITFDYNVDRYGAAAQKCYCGEPNCIGFLGGKTQTNAASLLPQSFSDALGIPPSMEKKWLRMKRANGETIAKNNEENINEEFVNSLEIIPCKNSSDITKVMSVLLQIENKMFALKLFQRLFPITDESLLYQVIKFHGYKCFNHLLDIFKDKELVTSDILNFLSKLPKTTKNGILMAQLDTKLKQIIQVFPNLKYQCDELLQKWESYEEYTRITKRNVDELSNLSRSLSKLNDLRRVRLPPGWEIIQVNGRPLYYNAQNNIKLDKPPNISQYNNSSSTNISQRSAENFDNTLSQHKNKDRQNLRLDKPFVSNRNSMKRHNAYQDHDKYDFTKKSRYSSEEPHIVEKRKDEEVEMLKAKLEAETAKRLELDRIIQEANRQKEIERKEKEKLQKSLEEKRMLQKRLSNASHIEHKWNKFFASFVPNMVRKYKTEITLSHENIKECAREITKILSSKEMKRDPKSIPPSKPSKEKYTKVQSFVNIYMEKFIYKYKQNKYPDKSITPSASS